MAKVVTQPPPPPQSRHQRQYDGAEKPRKTIAEIQRLAPGDLPREMDLHRLADAARDLLLPRGRDEECDVVPVRDEAGFEQHRRGIGRLQHDEGGEAVRGGAEFDLVGRLALEQPREVGGEVHRLALGEVEQDRRYVAAVRAEVDAIDDVRLVFARRKPRRLAVGRSEEHTSELQSLMRISYAVFCLTQK